MNTNAQHKSWNKLGRKIIQVRGTTPDKSIDAEQLATFTYYVKNVQFRFIVTRLIASGERTVTHRASGLRLATVEPGTVIAALGDYATAGRMVVQSVISQHGANKVFDCLRAAEVSPACAASQEA